jgi:hypothetical protein
VLFTTQIPRPLFDAIVMTYRYEWRAMSYALFMHENYPPFDFDLSCKDVPAVQPHRLSGNAPHPPKEHFYVDRYRCLDRRSPRTPSPI